MRRPALFVLFALLVLTAGCGKKPDPAPEPNLGGVVLAPPAPAPVWPATPFAGKTAQEWEGELRSDDKKCVILALSAIRAWGKPAAPLVPAVMALGPKYATDAVLASIGPAEAAALLRDKLQSPDPRTRIVAVERLQRFGQEREACNRVLAEALADPDANRRRYALDLVIASGADQTMLPALRKLMADPDGKTRLAAARLVAKLESDTKDHVPVLMASLDDRTMLGDTDLRDGWDKRCLPALAEFVRAKKQPRPTQLTTATTIAYLAEPMGPDAFPLFTEAMTGELERAAPGDGQAYALIDLGRKLGPKLQAVPPELLRWAKSEDTSLVVRAAAIRVLGMCGQKDVAPVAREILETFPYKYSNHMDMYPAAVEALTDLGDSTVFPFVRKVLAELEEGKEVTSFDHPGVYGPILRAIERFPDKHAEYIPLLRKIIERNRGQGKSWYVASTLGLLAPDEPLVYRAWAAAGALGRQYQPLFAARIDKAKDIAVPHFRKLLSDADPTVAFGAAAALLRYGPPDPEIVKVLGANIEDKRYPGNANPRLFEALPEIGPNCIPVLLEWLDHPNDRVRYEAARYLHRFGPAAASHAPAIIARVGKEQTVYRKKDLLHAIRLMGPAAKEHAAPLAPLLADPDMSVRYFAVRALAELDPKSPLLAKPCIDLYRACGKDPAKFGLPRLTWVGDTRSNWLMDPHSKDWPHHAAARILYGVAPEEALAAGIADPAVGTVNDFEHLYAAP